MPLQLTQPLGAVASQIAELDDSITDWQARRTNYPWVAQAINYTTASATLAVPTGAPVLQANLYSGAALVFATIHCTGPATAVVSIAPTIDGSVIQNSTNSKYLAQPSPGCFCTGYGIGTGSVGLHNFSVEVGASASTVFDVVQLFVVNF